jgi:hypothetical protein
MGAHHFQVISRLGDSEAPHREVDVSPPPLQLRADYRVPDAATPELWHIVERGRRVGLCGCRLAPIGELQSILRLHAVPGPRVCPACRIRHESGLSVVTDSRISA